VRLATLKENRNFYISTLQKCEYDGLKLILGIQIRIRLDPDLFGQFRILKREMAVRGAIFHTRIPFGIVAIPPDLRSLIYGFTAQRTVALKRLIFKWKKGVANHGLGLI
jgi:hypothetical protein